MTYKINYNNILNMDWVRRVRRATFDLLSDAAESRQDLSRQRRSDSDLCPNPALY
jgi:hypothetical protein